VVVLISDWSPSGVRVGRTLVERGFDVWQAETFDERRSLLSSVCPDYLITELWPEDRDGRLIIHEVRRHSPRTRTVITTAYASVGSALSIMRAGVHDYMAKPVTISRILEALGSPMPSGEDECMSIEDACSDYIRDAFHTFGSVAKTARALGLDRRSLRRMLARVGVTPLEPPAHDTHRRH
jgi:ActR/RegA family two-component response regulator